MLSLPDIVRALGGLVTRIDAGRSVEVDDLTLAEPGRGTIGLRGDLLLGVGVDEIDAAVDLVARAGAAGVGAVLLRIGTARDPRVREAADDADVALVGLADFASWAHTIWLLRGMLDRALGHSGDISAEQDDLFAFADAVAGLVDAAITIEDTRSRVLAHSSGPGRMDSTRVSTIVGRRVPSTVLSSLRARGVFRRMAKSDEPFFVTGDSRGELTSRLVVPIHAGGQWLGSIWAVVDEMPDPDVLSAVRRTASIIAVHLLQLRSQADLAHRVATDRLRLVLTGGDTEPAVWLPPGPWRVVALGSPVHSPGSTRHLDLWEAILRRRSWHQPLLADIGDHTFALLRDTSRGAAHHDSDARAAGTWVWFTELMADLAADGSRLVAGAGRPVATQGELTRSRAEATEVLDLVVRGRVAGPVATTRSAWAAMTLDRTGSAIRTEAPPVVVTALQAIDADEGADFARTLAAWLDHLDSPSTAATELGIHPNTVRHRMRRIRGVLASLDGVGVDLDSPRDRLALRLALLAHEPAGADPAAQPSGA